MCSFVTAACISRLTNHRVGGADKNERVTARLRVSLTQTEPPMPTSSKTIHVRVDETAAQLVYKVAGSNTYLSIVYFDDRYQISPLRPIRSSPTRVYRTIGTNVVRTTARLVRYKPRPKPPRRTEGSLPTLASSPAPTARSTSTRSAACPTDVFSWKRVLPCLWRPK